MPDPAPAANPSTQAMAHMAVATLFFFFMSVAVKAAAPLPTLQIVFFRALVALVLCMLQLRWEGVPATGTHRSLLLARGAFGTAALCCYFGSLGALPLATAVVLQNLSPLFTVALAVFVLGERVRAVQIVLFAVAAVGVWLVEGSGDGGTALGVALAVGGAALSACAYACISAIGPREHPLVVVLWFPLVTVPAIGPVLPWIWVWPTAGQWVALLAVGGFVQIAQVFMTRAYQHGRTSAVSMVSYLGVLWGALGGWALFDELPTPTAAAGMALVLAAVIGTSRVPAAPPRTSP